MAKKAEAIPRVVWIFWDKGLSQAPEVVKLCHRSWVTRNPDYEIRVLDSSSVKQWVDPVEAFPNLGHLPIQQLSDLIRLELLARFGGVWVDATLFCLRPLSEWLNPNHRAGFYLVDVPDSSDKLFDTFFIASQPHGKFVNRWSRLLQKFMSISPELMTHQMTKRLLKKIPLLRPKLGRVLFTTRLLRNRFGYPYFIAHYIGTRVLLTSPSNFLLWLSRQKTQTAKFSRLIRPDGGINLLRRQIDVERLPFIKLTHKALPDQREKLSLVISELEKGLVDK